MAIKPQQIASVYGLITGLSLIAFTAILYVGGVNFYLGSVAYLGYVILLGLAILATIRQKQAGGGLLEFRDALKTAYMVFVIALACQTLFTWLLLNYLDLNFKHVVAETSLRKAEEFLHKLNMPEDKIDAAMKEAREKDPFTLGRSIMGLVISYIVFFLVALVIAAIIKKKKPEFE